MNYREKVAYLMKVKEMNTSDPEIKRREQIIEGEVLDFEYNAFVVIENEIKNEKIQIEFLKSQIKTSTDEMFQAFCNSEINRHKENITNYGNQIYSLYFREKIIDKFEQRKDVCKSRIDYAQKELENNLEDKVAKIALENSEHEMQDITFSLDLINGRDIDLMNSYLNVSDIGKKIGE